MKFYRLLEVFEHFIREGFVVVVPHERVRVPFMATEDAKGGPKNVSDEPSAIVLRRAALARPSHTHAARSRKRKRPWAEQSISQKRRLSLI